MIFLLKHVSYQSLKDFDNIDSSVEQTNKKKVNDVIHALTPLIVQLSMMDDLIKPDDSIFTFAKRTNPDEKYDIRHVIMHAFERFSYHQLLEYFRILHTKLRDRVSITREDWSAFTCKALWLPFGEETNEHGELQLDLNFHTAVESAMRAAQTIIDAIQQPQMQAMEVGMAVEGSDAMVQLDQGSAKYIYIYDGSQFVQTQVGVRYNVPMLGYLTPRGIVNDLIMEEDYGTLLLNQDKVKQFAFRLTAASRDNPRVTFTFSNYEHNLPLNDQAEVQLHIYVPVSQQNVVIPMSYHSDYVDVQLPSLSILQLPPLNLINPTEMIELFARDLRNVHLHADMRVPQSPLEQLVSARVNFAQITEPICKILDDLVIITSGLENSVGEKYALKIPYLYCINMQEMTCTKRRILKHDLQISLFDNDKFNELNIRTNIETHLIRYTLFQMMLTYRKFTWDDFKSCPPYCVMFDLYLRRGAGSVGYHYDLTPGTIVSSVGLLYSMPPDDVMMGAQLIPLKYRTDRHISSTNVKAFNPLVVRNTALLFNNAVWTHSTPAVDNIISRMEHKVGYEVRDDAHNIIYNSELNVTYNPIEFPESIMAKIKRSSENPSRTFLRSWHVVSISESQLANLAPHHEGVVFPNYTFEELAKITLGECFVWLQGSNCMCIEVGLNLKTGEINPPGKLPGYHGGKIMPSNLARSNPNALAPSKLSKSKTHAHSPYKKISFGRRSSTTSVSHLKQQISSKLKQLRAVLQNPEKNVVVMAGKPRRTRSHSHTKISRKSSASKYTRKVRSV